MEDTDSCQSYHVNSDSCSSIVTTTTTASSTRKRVRGVWTEERLEERKKKVYEAVQKTRMKQRNIRENEIKELSSLETKVKQLYLCLKQQEPRFPLIPKYVGEKIDDVNTDRRHQSRDKRCRAMSEEEKRTRTQQQNRESQYRRIQRQKIEDINRKGNILFLTRQVKYLEAILNTLNPDSKQEKNPATSGMEFALLTHLLMEPKYQTPPPSLLCKKEIRRKFRTTAVKHEDEDDGSSQS